MGKTPVFWQLGFPGSVKRALLALPGFRGGSFIGHFSPSRISGTVKNRFFGERGIFRRLKTAFFYVLGFSGLLLH